MGYSCCVLYRGAEFYGGQRIWEDNCCVRREYDELMNLFLREGEGAVMCRVCGGASARFCANSRFYESGVIWLVRGGNERHD